MSDSYRPTGGGIAPHTNRVRAPDRNGVEGSSYIGGRPGAAGTPSPPAARFGAYPALVALSGCPLSSRGFGTMNVAVVDGAPWLDAVDNEAGD